MKAAALSVRLLREQGHVLPSPKRSGPIDCAAVAPRLIPGRTASATLRSNNSAGALHVSDALPIKAAQVLNGRTDHLMWTIQPSWPTPPFGGVG